MTSRWEITLDHLGRSDINAESLQVQEGGRKSVECSDVRRTLLVIAGFEVGRSHEANSETASGSQERPSGVSQEASERRATL
jgi:hypothetical protein